MKRGKKFLVIFVLAMATFMVMGRGEAKAASKKSTDTNWQKIGGKYRYRTDADTLVKKKVKKIKGKYYYFNAKGNRKSGWVQYKNKTYYFNKKKGFAYTGLKKIKKSKYIFSKKGVLLEDKGLHNYKNHTYYIGESGKLQSGFVDVDGNLKYFDKKSCALVKKDFVLDGEQYLVDENANLRTGVLHYQGKEIYCTPTGKWLKGVLIKYEENAYYADANGYLVTGLHQISSSKYYFGSDYIMRTGVVKLGKTLYFFEQSGKMIVNSWITTSTQKYYADEAGRLKKNCWFGGSYFGNDGCVVKDATALNENEQGYLTKKVLDRAKAYNATKLMIVAHPDDEALWGGAHLADGGYFVLCLTHGKDSKRKKEFDNVMKASRNIGLMLDYPDEIKGVRSDWSNVKGMMAKDLNVLMKYKKWSQVVTHNPEGEYGHLHHKLTNKMVTQAYYCVYQSENLYYFGRHYNVKTLPTVAATLPRVSDTSLSFKRMYLQYYVSQAVCVAQHDHMSPYENWIVSTNWE